MLSTFVREKQTEPEVTQMFKYSWCPPVKPGPRPGAARPGPASRLYGRIKHRYWLFSYSFFV